MDRAHETGRPDFLHIVDASRWQRVQDHCASVLGVPLRTVGPARELLVNPSWPLSFDAERIISALKIGEELDALLPQGATASAISSTTTPLGVTYAVVPVRASADWTIAYMIVGPMIVGPRESELSFRSRLQGGIGAAALWPVVLSLKLYTFAGIRSALTLLEEIGGAIAELGYQMHELSGLVPMAGWVDRAAVAYQTDRILQSLLAAAAFATKAEGGSVMTYDQEHDVLRVAMSQGLRDGAAHASVGRSEGLSGLAITEQRILLVDDHTADDALRSRMHRPELVSSLVAPVTAESDQPALGVLNLRTADPLHRFTAEHVELLRRLLDLAKAALSSLRALPDPNRS